MKNALLPKRLRYWLLPILPLVLLINYVSQARLRSDDPAVRPGLKSAPERPKEIAPKSKVRRARRKQAPASSDPIRFTLQANKRQVAVGEEIELTITAQLMSLSPNLMFFLPGSNAYTLKLLTPAGFQATGGDFAEYVTGELTYPAKTQATYHLRGHFISPTEGLSFRLLRSHGQANSQSLYEEKARLQIAVQAQADGAARLADPCAGISLSAQASPATVSTGGSVNLSANCTGCGSSGGSTLYSTNFDGQVPNTDFLTDMGDAVRILSNAQNVSDTYYCSVGDHSGNGGKLLRFNGENSGRVWEKSVSVTNGTTYTFSMWVRPIYDGTPASGNSPQTIQLKVNGGVQGSPTLAASNPGCGSGWVQLSVTWVATTTGSVPFTLQMPTGSSWQKAFVVDDIQISSSGGGSGASYAWTALQGGSTIATANSASTQVIVPTTAGTYQYQVILNSGGCTISKDVSVTVTGGTTCDFTPTAAVSNTSPPCNGTVSLSATCSGADCNNGVTYAWAGPNGFNQNGHTVNATVPNSTGNYSYTVTASKSGCTDKKATVAVNTTCNTPIPRFYVGRAVPGVFDPELYQDGTGDWWIREKATSYSDSRPRHYNINRAHVPDGPGGLLSASGYKLGKRGGRYIVEMTRWQGPDSWRRINIEAFRMEFILPGYVDELGAIPTPATFVPEENYIDRSVAMVPAHDTLKGKITVKVKYNQEHQDIQLYNLGATHLGKNTSENNRNNMQFITGEPWDGWYPVNTDQFKALPDATIINTANNQDVAALYFTDFETHHTGWWDTGLQDLNLLRKFYTYHEALISSHPGRLITDYYRNIVSNKGFPDPGNGRPNPLAQHFKDQYNDPNSAVTHAYRTFDRGNGMGSASLRNLFNIWLLDDYGRETFDPDNQYELYRPYSMIHDSRIMRKVVGNGKKIISYAWPGADYDIGYKLKREIPGKGWVSHYARRYKSAAAVETETYLAYLVTDGYSPFHDQASSTNNPEQACPWGEDTWDDPINGSPSPIQNRLNCYPREPQYYNEHVNLAEYKLSQVNDILDGGYAQDAEFSYGGGTWLNKAEEGQITILNRAANKQHIVLKKVKDNNKAFVMAANPFANESDKSTLTVKLAEDWSVEITTSGKWPTLKKFTR